MCVRSDWDGTYPEVQHVRLLVALDIHEYLYNYSALFTSINALRLKFNDMGFFQNHQTFGKESWFHRKTFDFLTAKLKATLPSLSES